MSNAARIADLRGARPPTPVTGFSIHLYLAEDGWEVTCISVADPRITLKATCGTPAQALAEITRQINRYLYRQAHPRPAAEDAEPTIPLISISADNAD